jgi:hypothetical protein
MWIGISRCKTMWLEKTLGRETSARTIEGARKRRTARRRKFIAKPLYRERALS